MSPIRKSLFAVCLIALALSFIPFNTTVVPAWRIQVVDQNGNPRYDIWVDLHCEDYTLGESCNDSQVSDEHGYVAFPEKQIRLNLFTRIARSVRNYSFAYAQGGSRAGQITSIEIRSVTGDRKVDYIRGQPLPEKIVFPVVTSDPVTR